MSIEPTTPVPGVTIPSQCALSEWKMAADGKSVKYGKKYYLSQKRVATLRLGLPIHVLAKLRDGTLPNGEPADVIHDTESRSIFFNKELVDQLQQRFAYADTGESLGRCKVHNGPWKNGLAYEHPRTENHLRSVSQVRRDLRRDDDRLGHELSKWLETGTGPAGIRVRRVRDVLTGDELLTFRTLSEIRDGLRR